MYPCSNCRMGTPDELCTACGGRGFVYVQWITCTQCEGAGCSRCTKGYIPDPLMFLEPAKVFTKEELHEALFFMRTGYTHEEDMQRPAALGVLSMLLGVSRDVSDVQSAPHGTFLQDVLDADAIIIEPSGIWSQHGDMGVRIYHFPWNT